MASKKQAKTTAKPTSKTKGKTKAKTRALGFLAVSATAARGMMVYPIMPGFDSVGPSADLQAQLAKDGDWRGHAVSISGKGTVRLKKVRAKA